MNEKEALTTFFYNKVEEAKRNYSTYLGVIEKTTTLTLENQRKVRGLYINYRKRKRFPSEQLVLAFIALFTEEEATSLLTYIENNRPENYVEESNTIDEYIAKQVFKEWLNKELEQAKGSYKAMVRQTGVFTPKENTNIASYFRQLKSDNRLPNSHLLNRIKPCMSEKEYLIIYRAISEKESTLDAEGEVGIELGKTMTDEERRLQRALRLEQRKQLLGMMKE